MIYQLLVTVLVCTLLGIGGAKPDFSGNWKPDESKSTAHKTLKTDARAANAAAPPPPPADAHLPSEKIDHKEPALRIATFSADGEWLNDLALTTDGKENINQLASGAVIHRSRSHWQGDTLVTLWRIERDGTKVIEGEEQRSLSEGNRVLTIKRHTEDGKSVSESVIVLRRQT